MLWSLLRRITLTRKKMRPINLKEKVYDYSLIDYGNKVPLALITKESKPKYNPKVFKFTEREAHDLNYALALNGAGKRYIKINESQKQ